MINNAQNSKEKKEYFGIYDGNTLLVLVPAKQELFLFLLLLMHVPIVFSFF